MNTFTDYTKMPIEQALKDFNKWPALFIKQEGDIVTCSMMRVPRPALVLMANDPHMHHEFLQRLNRDPVDAWHYLKSETGFGFSPFSLGDHARLKRTGIPPDGIILSQTHISNLKSVEG